MVLECSIFNFASQVSMFCGDCWLFGNGCDGSV